MLADSVPVGSDRKVINGESRSLTGTSRWRSPRAGQLRWPGRPFLQAGDLRPPRCAIVSAESRPSRCAVAYASLDNVGRDQGQAATKREGRARHVTAQISQANA
jgi:hypothetical protein